MTPFGLLLVALASYRLTRLVALDDITEPPRSWLERRMPGKLADLISCPFCSGVYISLAVAAVWLHGRRLGYWLVVLAAVIGAQALLSSWEGE